MTEPTASTGGVSTRTSADETNSNATATSPNEIDRPDVASAHDAGDAGPAESRTGVGKTEAPPRRTASASSALESEGFERTERVGRERNGESAATEFTVDADANVDSPAGARRRRALRDAGVDKSRGHGRNSSTRAREMAGVGEGGRGANLEQSAAGGGDDARGDLVHRLFGAVRERQLRRGRREETVRQPHARVAEDDSDGDASQRIRAVETMRETPKASPKAQPVEEVAWRTSIRATDPPPA